MFGLIEADFVISLVMLTKSSLVIVEYGFFSTESGERSSCLNIKEKLFSQSETRGKTWRVKKDLRESKIWRSCGIKSLWCTARKPWSSAARISIKLGRERFIFTIRVQWWRNGWRSYCSEESCIKLRIITKWNIIWNIYWILYLINYLYYIRYNMQPTPGITRKLCNQSPDIFPV